MTFRINRLSTDFLEEANELDRLILSDALNVIGCTLSEAEQLHNWQTRCANQKVVASKIYTVRYATFDRKNNQLATPAIRKWALVTTETSTQLWVDNHSSDDFGWQIIEEYCHINGDAGITETEILYNNDIVLKNGKYYHRGWSTRKWDKMLYFVWDWDSEHYRYGTTDKW